MESKGIMKKIPNIITILRLLMVPVFVCAFILDYRSGGGVLIALAVFIIAFLSDLLDGYLARKYDAISNFGKLADPFADKLLAISAIVCLCVVGFLPLVAVIIIAAKELLMIIGGVVLLKYKFTVSANWAGKVSALLTNIAVGACFLHNYIKYWDWYLLYLALAMQIFALVQYTIVNVILPAKKGEIFRR